MIHQYQKARNTIQQLERHKYWGKKKPGNKTNRRTSSMRDEVCTLPAEEILKGLHQTN